MIVITITKACINSVCIYIYIYIYISVCVMLTCCLAFQLIIHSYYLLLLSSLSQEEEEKMLKIRSRIISSTWRSLLLDISSNKFSTHSARKLEGKVAVITGAASGIGKESAAKFISHGAKVIVADIHRQLGQQTASELGDNATFVPCDVTKESDVSDLVDFAVSKHGQLDIMYNNAGVACRTPLSIVDIDLAQFDRVMAINVRGVMAGIKHAARVMIPRGSGCILCTGSVTGVMGGLAQPTYSTTKSCVIGIVRSMTGQLGKNGIRINCVSPFAIPTAFSLDEMKEYFPGVEPEDLTKMLHNTSELKGAYCEPIDVANAALFLASEDAKFISGQNLVVDGGFTSFKSLNLSQQVQERSTEI